jgi:hypothetical protein
MVVDAPSVKEPSPAEIWTGMGTSAGRFIPAIVPYLFDFVTGVVDQLSLNYVVCGVPMPSFFVLIRLNGVLELGVFSGLHIVADLQLPW